LYVVGVVAGMSGNVQPLIGMGVMAAIGFSWLSTLMLWPVYLRVSPGVLEVIRYNVWGGRVVQRDVFDVRTARVRLMPFQIFVQPPGERMYQIDCPWSWATRSLSQDVLKAARWRGELPVLAGDRLT
jgi:hypothetical protein